MLDSLLLFSFSSPISCTGGETTATDLTQELKDVWHRWYEIGVALRIPTHELDAICLGQDSVMGYFRVFTTCLISNYVL